MGRRRRRGSCAEERVEMTTGRQRNTISNYDRYKHSNFAFHVGLNGIHVVLAATIPRNRSNRHQLQLQARPSPFLVVVGNSTQQHCHLLSAGHLHNSSAMPDRPFFRLSEKGPGLPTSKTSILIVVSAYLDYLLSDLKVS